jgi:tRNA pseudouridine13 synthase
MAQLSSNNTLASQLLLDPAHFSSIIPQQSTDATVGISCYLRPENLSAPTVSAVIKQFSNDFIVREIDSQGQIAQLTSTNDPEEVKTLVEPIKLDESQIKSQFLDLIGETHYLAMLEFIENEKKLLNRDETGSKKAKRSSGNEFLFENLDLSKEQRGKLHELIRNHYSFLISDVVEGKTGPNKRTKADSTTAIPEISDSQPQRVFRVRFTALTAAADRDKRKISDFWPKTRGNYCQFVLWKENLGTLEAVHALSTQLHVKSKTFSWAGTKDKRAITTQFLSAYKISVKKLQEAVKRHNNWQKNSPIMLGNFKYAQKPLTLGELRGNFFSIVLRNLKFTAISAENGENGGDKAALIELLSERLACVQRSGFINYYGTQRFGTSGIPTHLIGLKLLQNDFLSAISLILLPRSGESPQVTQAREYFAEKRDPKGALQKFPHFLHIERAILQLLATKNDNSGGWGDVLGVIPRVMRLMYVHAAQSFLWNKMVTVRLTQFDNSKPILGDLIIVNQGKKVEEGPDTNNNGENGQNSEETAEISEEYDEEHEEISVRPLSAEDLATGQFTLADIVLPLPGFAVIYPDNGMAQHYSAILQECQLNSDSFKGTKHPDFILRGSYRPILASAADLNWKFLRYNDAGAKIVLNDREKLQGNVESGVQQQEQGNFLGLVLEFSLRSSIYATMLLREIIRNDTAQQVHKVLAAQHSNNNDNTAAKDNLNRSGSASSRME